MPCSSTPPALATPGAQAHSGQGRRAAPSPLASRRLDSWALHLSTPVKTVPNPKQCGPTTRSPTPNNNTSRRQLFPADHEIVQEIQKAHQRELRQARGGASLTDLNQAAQKASALQGTPKGALGGYSPPYPPSK